MGVGFFLPLLGLIDKVGRRSRLSRADCDGE